MLCVFVNGDISCFQDGADLQAKIASLEAQVKEKDAREHKFKQLTLKAKKESSDLKAKVSIRSGNV